MSFNLDDPLAGILSDGSDDSFFDDDILGKKKPDKKKGATPTVEKKSALFDLGDSEKAASNLDIKKDLVFDLGGDIKKSSIYDESQSKPTTQTTSKRIISKEPLKIESSDIKSKPFNQLDLVKSPAKSKASTSVDKLDILSEFDEDKKGSTKIAQKGKSSQSLLDDILGIQPSKTSNSSQPSRPVTAAKSREFDLDSFLGKSESKQSESSMKTIPQKQSNDTENTKEEKNKNKKKSSSDWLGVFQDNENDILVDDGGDMPSWLTGKDSKKKNNDKNSTKEAIKDNRVEEPDVNAVKENEEDTKATQEQVQKPAVNELPNVSVMQQDNDDVTAESTALYLQQQESQLMLALQLKAQEEKLIAMQMRQKESQRVQREATLARNAHLDAILQKQAGNRIQMQSIIAAHQERITQRIKDLLGTNSNEYDDTNNPIDEYDGTTPDQRVTPHAKERKQLLQLVQALQDNHDKEIDLMETSYRRQLAFLEVSLNQSEERMKDESDKLVKFYTEKINWLEEHHNMYKNLTEENLNSLSERHKSENEMLRQQHLENVRVLQEHHAALMENVKNAVKQEHALIKDSASFSSDLQELIADIKENKSQCQLLVERVQSLSESTQKENDRSLLIRETQIKDMIQQLKKDREYFEIEKTESRELVKMLEARLKQMTTMIEEETVSLKQKKMEFEFEKATFGKQTEFAKSLLKKQDEEIKMLREEIQKEYNEKMAKIDEEKNRANKENAIIAKDKASVQNLKQELEKMKGELQAQLEEVTEEKSKLNVERQQMNMEEQRIVAKSRDLDLLAKTAIDKQSQADKKYSEADFLQHKYEDRIRRMQEHVVSLNSREKQIAREKIALSRERLTLHNERKQIETKQCSLCKSSQNSVQYNIDPFTIPESYFSVSREYKNANVNNAMNAIEQEMAHLMGRNFNLKHSAGIADVRSYEERIIDDNVGGGGLNDRDVNNLGSGTFKDYMDPKFMMLRLDVQKVLSNLDQSKKDDIQTNEDDKEQ
ncbi:hypothetical protein K1T71_005991 [Dendrolimus kikuchii]|uniref:Uncharacterized protein n=1 Tax=Dendrolimus kikuchii TaxID=765133 RepID=A0ACC1D3J7_9NEOP|nr:hypothetical protein K1T71_005991 [Dendrolimus kikuchii]